MLKALWMLASAATLLLAIVAMFRFCMMRLKIPSRWDLYIPSARDALAAIVTLYMYTMGIIAMIDLIVGLFYELHVFTGRTHIIMGIASWLLMAAIWLFYYLVDKRLTFLMSHPRHDEIWLTLKPPFQKKQA